MINWRIACVALVLFASGIECLAQVGGRPWLKSYEWQLGKWGSDPPELVAMRKKMFRLFLQDVPDLDEVDKEYRSIIEKYKGNLSSLELGKLLIINSFFWNHHSRHRFDLYYEMRASVGINCYEYARGAFALFAAEGDYLTPWLCLGGMKSKWPEDPAIFRSIIAGRRRNNPNKSQPSAQDTINAAEKLLKLYPQRDESGLTFASGAYLFHWGETKSETSIKKLIEANKKILKHPQTTPRARNQARLLLSKYEKLLKP
jgi:hypothetical protein